MQTNFTAKQLKDPRTAEIDKILRKCVHCGFCTATCPTYVLLGDERDSPRGRIYLMKEMFERGRKASPGAAPRRPLPVVPVVHDDLPERRRLHAPRRPRPRAHRGDGHAQLQGSPIRAAAGSTLPHPSRFRLALVAARLARPFAGLLAGSRRKN